MSIRLAIDVGASSGRHILGWTEDGALRLEEAYRFPNGPVERSGSLCWDLDAIYGEVLNGLKKCAEYGMVPQSAGIDTWGADFVLTDADGRILGDTAAYRDKRTAGMDAEVFRHVSEEELYARTGVQTQPFNSIFQLMAVKTRSPGLLERAARFLMTPDYLRFLLCGEAVNEYTIATTTGLVGAASGDWDGEIIALCGFPRGIFGPLAKPGAAPGRFTKKVRDAAGFDATVVLTPSHDTACAFLAAPARDENAVFISSGTWSLIGVESAAPLLSGECRAAGLSNEGGYGGRFRLLKNIMGLWMVQSVRRELGGSADFGELEKLAGASRYQGTVDVNDSRFYAPASMTQAVADVCRENGYPPPDGAGDTLRCIYRSLALSYAETVGQLERLTGKRYTSINIVGGGCRDGLLNTLTAQACGLPVYAGPAEGTALGNIVSQMLQSGELDSVDAARALIRGSFEIKEFLP